MKSSPSPPNPDSPSSSTPPSPAHPPPNDYESSPPGPHRTTRQPPKNDAQGMSAVLPGTAALTNRPIEQEKAHKRGGEPPRGKKRRHIGGRRPDLRLTDGRAASRGQALGRRTKNILICRWSRGTGPCPHELGSLGEECHRAGLQYSQRKAADSISEVTLGCRRRSPRGDQGHCSGPRRRRMMEGSRHPNRRGR